MESFENTLLRLGVEINEKIAAGNEIAAREGRVPQKIVRSEEDLLAHFLPHPITSVVPGEKFAQPFRRDVGFDG